MQAFVFLTSMGFKFSFNLRFFLASAKPQFFVYSGTQWGKMAISEKTGRSKARLGDSDASVRRVACTALAQAWGFIVTADWGPLQAGRIVLNSFLSPIFRPLLLIGGEKSHLSFVL